MPKDQRHKLLAQMHELAGARRRYKAEFDRNLDATPEQATVETLELIGLLLDDWNADLEISHQELSERTARLAGATDQLDRSTANLETSTDRLDRRTRNLTIATWVLIIATLFLALTKFLPSHQLS